MKKKSISMNIFMIVVSVISISCGSVGSQSENTFNSSENLSVFPKATASLDPSSTSLLCERLAELKEIPYYPGEVSEDPIYNGLMKAGDKAIPCLIEKITDTTRIDDPRIAPHIQDFTVGDAAVWLLLYVTKMEWQPETMFPPEYAKRWKTEGVYAYFAYVEKPANRKRIQMWWKTWMKENLHIPNSIKEQNDKSNQLGFRNEIHKLR